jgi:GNAT superfamily N-acetyltransferase
VSVGHSGEAPRWPDAAWLDSAIGHRVTVRTLSGDTGPTGGPAFHDVVGVLERADEAPVRRWHVRTRRGQLVAVDPDVVVAAKVVPDAPARRRTASDIGIDELERIAADGWQPLERSHLGDWVLRAAAGYSGRANSVQAIGDPGRPLDDALAMVTDWYRQRGLVPKVQVALPLLAELDAQLAERAWSAGPPVLVQVVDLAALQQAASTAPAGEDVTVTVDRVPDASWLAAFRYGDQPLPPAAEGIMTRADHPVFVAVRDAGGTPRAITRGAITPRWLGITAVEVAEPWRRQGLGRRVIVELARYAARYDVRHVYLQVAEDNAPARALYAQLGFTTHHSYLYRQEPEVG